VQLAADKDVQIAGDSGTATNVRFNIAVHVPTAATLIFQVIKVMQFKLSSAECGHKDMHLTHLQLVQVLTLEHTDANGVVV
jgi:hypothetical protein